MLLYSNRSCDCTRNEPITFKLMFQKVSCHPLGFIWLLTPWYTMSFQILHRVSLLKAIVQERGIKDRRKHRLYHGTPPSTCEGKMERDIVPPKLTRRNLITEILQEPLCAEYLLTLSVFIYRHVNSIREWRTKREDYARAAVTTPTCSTGIQLTRLSGCDCMSPPQHDRCFSLSSML